MEFIVRYLLVCSSEQPWSDLVASLMDQFMPLKISPKSLALNLLKIE